MKNSRYILIAGLLVAIVSVLVILRWQATALPHVLPQFVNADRVVLGVESPISPIITITGHKAREIVRVITTAKTLPRLNGLPKTFGIILLNEVRFYQGTNYLGMIDTSCGLFSAGGFDGYEAEKGKLEPLVDDPYEKALGEYQRAKGLTMPPNTSLEPTGVGAGSSAARFTSRVAGGSALGR